MTEAEPGALSLQEFARTVAGQFSWDILWNAVHWPLLASVTVVAGIDFGRQGYSLPTLVWPAGPLLISAGLHACWILLRAALEDEFLSKNLEGYEDYRGRVRFRLIPYLF